MQPTPLARAVLAAAGGLLFAAFLTGSVLAAAIGFGVVLYVLHARNAARAAFAATTVRVRRRVLEPVLHEGAVFHVELDATGSAVAPGVTLVLRDAPPVTVDTSSPPAVQGAAAGTYAATATVRGSRRFGDPVASLTDGRGMWSARRRVHVPTEIRILAPLDALEAGRRLARRRPLEVHARSPVGLLVRDLEFESIRPYAPGDRLRDVDWKRVARYRRLMTKTWERELEATVVLLVDASRTMRGRRGAFSKLDHASALSLELAEAATDRNYRVGFAAFDENRVVDEIPPSRDRGFPRRLAEHLNLLPGRILARRRLDVGLVGDAPAGEADLDFLERLGALAGRRLAKPRRGVQEAVEALRAAAAGDKLFVVAFTDLETLPDAATRALSRIVSEGHRVVTVVLPGTRFLEPPARVSAAELEAAYREDLVRRRGKARLRGVAVEVLELGPADHAAAVADMSARTPARARGGMR